MDKYIGKKLDGRYEIRELIGVGGMANVYKAVMLGHNGPVPAGTVVAVKVLRQEYMHDPDLVRRFKNESKAISLLNHPNIVKVYDVSVNDDLQYIVMEYVDGMTLREYLNQRGGRLTNRETVHFISQILKALEHAHANGVVHRDIKPQNIMLLDNGQLRMMDFGIARISRAENQLLSGKAMGSVHYISPEQAKGDETDCTSDIYSVGVMMYEMLSGQLPFDAEDAVEVAIKQISDQPKSLHEIAPQVPAALVEITEKAMAKLPQNRYASAREMLDALDTYVQNPSVMFEYQYITEDAPEKVVKRTMNQNKAARQNHPNESAAPRGKKAKRKRRTIFLPVLFGITIAFKKLNFREGIWGSPWVGFKNFKFLFASADAWIITRNTILYNVAFFIVGNALAITIAILINEIQSRVAKKAYQSLILLPYLMSWVIVSYLAYTFLSAETGMFNKSILEPLGLEAVNWYQEKKYWPFILIFVSVWKSVGYSMIIYLSSVVGISMDYFEAAKIDGASKWQQIKYITLPLLKPTLITLFILSVGQIFRSDFGLFYQMPRNSGALYSVTRTLDVYVYQALMKNNDYSMSSAASVFQSVVGFILIIAANKLVKRYESNSALF